MAEPLPQKSTTEEEKICHFVIGTAGHIDHGKSVLVEALTGVHPDRLKEEQERGITIDLGFAPLELSNGLRAGIIDVPGHERFVKNMVAGASGIDFVILVVAADDGVMAQTREHLQILRLLDIPDGLVVITKADLAEPGFVELVAEEIGELAEGTCLEGKPILSVSAKTGQGLDHFRQELESALTRVPHRSADGPFRMPIQRVFSKEGFGTVTTGVPISGRLKIGDSGEIHPLGVCGRVKGMHAYKHKISEAVAGHSTAVNFSGIERAQVSRGMVVTTPGIFRPSNLLTVFLRHISDAPYPLKHRAPVRFHAGTAEILGRVLLLEDDRLAPDSETFAQILLDEPTVLCPGDRFILRHQSPVVTLGGGVVLDNVPQKRKRRNSEVLEELRERKGAGRDDRALMEVILFRSPCPKKIGELAAELGVLPERVRTLAERLRKKGKTLALKEEEVYLSKHLFEIIEDLVRKDLAAFFEEHPALGSIERPELRGRLERVSGMGWVKGNVEGLFEALVTLMEKQGVLECRANHVMLSGRKVKLDEKWSTFAEKIEIEITAGELAPPMREQIVEKVEIPPKALKEVLRYLVDANKIVEISASLYVSRTAFEGAREKVKAMFAQQAEWTTSDIRKELGISRKYVVPLVEAFDRMGFTRRVGDKRQLVNAEATL